MDRELTRAELEELLPLYALDALDGEELRQVERYLARDEHAREEVASLRDAASWIPTADVRAPESLWTNIDRALDASEPSVAPPLQLPPRDTTPVLGASVSRRATFGRRAVVVLAAAALMLAVVLGAQVVRQQDRIDELAAEMHEDPLAQQVTAARSTPGAHVIALDPMHGGTGAEIVMLPGGTGYLADHALPELAPGGTYQLWAKVGEGADARMVSLGVLGRSPGIAPFRLATDPTMFEITREPASGSDAPSTTVVARGEVA